VQFDIGACFLSQVPKAPLQESSFGLLFGQSQGAFVGLAGFGRSSQPAAQIGAGRVRQVVAV
jgi:hypothetical protein